MADIDTDDARAEAQQGSTNATLRMWADEAIARMQRAIVYLRQADDRLESASSFARAEDYDDISDVRKGIRDEISDIEGVMKRLGEV